MGRYGIVEHDGDHTHLVYVLELPRSPGPAQEAFNIEGGASYVIAVGNPEAPRAPVAGLDPERRASFPSELMERFGDRRWIPVDPPEFLDHEGAELVLIGAADAVAAELGIDLDAEHERLEEADIARLCGFDRGTSRSNR